MTINHSQIHRQAREILKSVYGENAEFREGQYEAIEATMTKKRTLVVQKTGWGKSLVYFICTKLFRRQNYGFTMVISPLLVLMENQADMAKKLGIKCDVLNSTVKDRFPEILNSLKNNELDLIFITPETLFSEDVQKSLPSMKIGLFVIDEAHCISDWGHDFRLEYGKLGKIINMLPSNIAVLGTTATANNRVIQDLKKQLNDDVVVLRGPLMRESLHIQVLPLQSKADRYAWILENINKLPGTGIIYCLTQRDCDYLTDFLSRNKISAMSYYSKSKELESTNTEAIDKLQKNRIKVIVATIKLGMGYDKGDISFIIHFQSPSNIVAYYQQIGRAGRSIKDAYVFLMAGEEDKDINNYFIDTAFPSEKEAEDIIKSIGSRNGSKLCEIENDVNIRRTRITKALYFLENEGYIIREGYLYYLAPKPFYYDKEHYDAVTETRRRELNQMNDLIETSECYSKFIVECLDDYSSVPCGKCSNCTGKDVLDGLTLSFDYQEKASEYINNLIMEFKPRKKWPDGKMITYVAENGICLSKYGDPGYGQLVKEGKYSRGQRFCDELVAKSAKVLKDYVTENNISHITNVPSLRSDIVYDFTKRLADRLNLKYIDVIDKSDSAPQKEMENSSHQFMNAWESFHVKSDCNAENIILVDDIVDSKWTLTVCAYKLMEAGCGKVFPFVLADSGNKG